MPVPYLRSDHRTALQTNTYGKVTAPADQDYFINEAETKVLGDVMTFFPGIGQQTRTSGATDSNGILLVTQGFQRFQRLEDAQKVKYKYIEPIDRVWMSAGWIFAGFDQTSKKQKLQVFYNNDIKALTTFYWWQITLVPMAAGDDDVSAVPDGYKDLINFKATQKYYASLGSSMAPEMAKWEKLYQTELSNAKIALASPQSDPEWIQSVDVDAGDIGGTAMHIVQ